MQSKLDSRSLRVDDWVLVNKKPFQLRTITAKIVTDDGEVLLSNVEGIKLREEDVEAVFKRVSSYDSALKATVTPAGRYGFYIELFRQYGEEPVRLVNRPVLYFHELQHSLQEVGCVAGLNYRWAQWDKEDEEMKKEGEEDAKRL